MSYKQTVLRDDPIAYWPLTGTTTLRTYATILEEYQTYQDWLNTEGTYGYQPGSIYFEDVSVNKNHAAVSFGTQLPTFQDIVTLNARLAGDATISGCKITDQSVISVFDIYNFFDKNYENGVFGAEFWVLFPDNPSTQVNLLSVYDSSQNINIFSAYAYNNAIYLTVTGSTGTYTTKKEIFSWDKKMHIFLSYSERNIQIMVNGIADETVSVPTNFKFTTGGHTYVKYRLGPAQSGKDFIINDLAFYTRKLSLNEIRNHMVWASINSNPEYAATQGSAYHLNLTERSDMIHLQKKFTLPADYNLGVYSNLIPDQNGLTIKQTATAGTQYGVWQYNFPVVQYRNFAGVSISWDSGTTPFSSVTNSQYAKVSASYDNGATWNPVLSNQIVPYFLQYASTAALAQLLVKVELYSADTSQAIQPRLDNLNIIIYKSLNIPSDAGGFVLSPVSSQTYMVRQDTDNILTRERNFGIHFVNQNPSNGYPGTAVINSTNNTSYQTVEFWFKYEGCQSNNLGAVLDTATVAGVDLYVNPSTSVLTSNLGSNGTLYVNGVAQGSGQYTVVAGELYHMVMVYNTSTTNPIYINGSTDGLSTPLQAMYGFITLFPGQLSATDISTRYLGYLSTQTSVVYDSVTTLGSIAEYSGASATSINGGLAVIAHDHTY